MASFKVLFVLFVALFALAIAADEVQREKKQIYGAIPAISAYSATAYPHAYAAHGYGGYPYAGYPYAGVHQGVVAPHHYYQHY